MTRPGRGWRPDGHVRYRTVPHGERVGIIPRRCKRLQHDLSATGYTHRIRRGADQYPPERDDYLVITCTACVYERHADSSWILILDGPPPARAEMDDQPYADIKPHYVEVPAGPHHRS